MAQTGGRRLHLARTSRIDQVRNLINAIRRWWSHPSLLVAAGDVASALYWGGPVLAALFSLRLTRPAWGGRAPEGQDTMALLIRSERGLDLLAHGHLDGWMPNFAVGYQDFLFYGPGQTLLIGATRLLTFGLLSTTGAYKAVALGSLAIFPFAVAWLARSMGLSRSGAGVAAILSLLVSNPFGVGLHAVFQNSLIAQQVAASLVFIVLGGVLRILVDPQQRWTMVTGVALAGLMVTHLISTVLLGLLLILAVPVAVVMHRPRPAAVKALFGAGFVAAGLSAFWLLPLLAHHDLHGPAATWGTPPLPQRLKELWLGSFVVLPHVAQLLAAASVYALYHLTRQRRWAAFALIIPTGYVLLGRFLLHRYAHNDLALQIENRGIGMVAVIATFPLAQLCGDATSALRRLGQFVAPVVAGTIVAVMVIRTIQPWTSLAGQTPPGSPSLQAAAVELRRIVPVGARWVEVRDYPAEVASTGVTHPDFWLAHQSRRWTLNSFNPESTSAVGPAFTPEHLLDRSPDAAAKDLARLGVAFVVATTAASAAALEGSSSFRPVWRDGDIRILEVQAPQGQPSPSSLVTSFSPAAARLDEATPEHLRISVQSTLKSTATVAVAWSPKWHGRINGSSVLVWRSDDGIIELQLPSGSGQLALDYSPDVWDRVGPVVSLGTAVGLVAAAVGRLRRRRAEAPGADAAPDDPEVDPAPARDEGHPA